MRDLHPFKHSNLSKSTSRWRRTFKPILDSIVTKMLIVKLLVATCVLVAVSASGMYCISRGLFYYPFYTVMFDIICLQTPVDIFGHRCTFHVKFEARAQQGDQSISILARAAGPMAIFMHTLFLNFCGPWQKFLFGEGADLVFCKRGWEPRSARI